MMTKKELLRSKTIQKFLNKLITLEEAAEALQLSTRQVLRIKTKYLVEEERGIIHKSRGRKPVNAISDEARQQIMDLYLSELYNGSNDHHFTELLGEYENIFVSRSSVRNILRSAGIPPARARRTKKVHRARQRKDQFGILVQTDASQHAWLEDRHEPFSLIGMIDDATSEVLSAIFRPTEDLRGYLEATQQMIKKVGIPGALYTDQHTIFRSPKEDLSVEQELNGECTPLSQFGQALSDLGIMHYKALSPQAKGRIERLWGTFQDRLIIELRLKGVSTIARANEVLPELIEKHNQKFAVEPAEPASAFIPYSNKLPLDHILCYRRGTRCIGSGQTISYKGNIYTTTNTERIFKIKSKVEIRETLSGILFIYSNENCYSLKKTQKNKVHKKESPTTNKTQKRVGPIKKKPAADHPWRQYSTKRSSKTTLAE